MKKHPLRLLSVLIAVVVIASGCSLESLSQSSGVVNVVVGYQSKGALNMVVVPTDSPAATLADLSGAKVSASVGSAGHGTLVRALARAGILGVEVLNQQPQVGASALESGQVKGLSQFVAWP